MLADHELQIDKSPYAYGWNNPIKYVDPNGLCPNGCSESEQSGEPYRDGAVVQNKFGATQYKDGKWHVIEPTPMTENSSNGIRINGFFGGGSSSFEFQGSKDIGEKNSGYGHAKSFSFGFSFGFGISGEWGTISDETGDSEKFYSIFANFGFGLDIGFNQKEIIPMNGKRFRVADYQGIGKNVTLGAGFTSESRGGNVPARPSISPFDFGTTYKERSNSLSPFLNIPLSPTDIGVLYQVGRTKLIKK